MLFETPTMAALVNAEDLSGIVKSALHAATKVISCAHGERKVVREKTE